MDLAELQLSIYEQIGWEPPTPPPSGGVARILRYINTVQREVLGKKGIGSRLRRQTLPCVTVSGSTTLVLPQAAVRAYQLVDRTNNLPLQKMSLGDQRFNDPGVLSSGNPYAWDELSYNSQVARDPSAAGQLTVVSDSASDDSTKKVFAEVVRTGGYFQAAGIALNGLTPVSLGPTDSLFVLKFYISSATGGRATATGNIILKDGAGNELSRIPLTRTYARYTRLSVYPVPSAALTLYADVDLHVEDMTQASDQPFLPEDFHDVLECGALKKEWKKREKMALYKIEEERWRKRVAELRAYLNHEAGAVMNDRHVRRFSQLGPNFPAGS